MDATKDLLTQSIPARSPEAWCAKHCPGCTFVSATGNYTDNPKCVCAVIPDDLSSTLTLTAKNDCAVVSNPYSRGRVHIKVYGGGGNDLLCGRDGPDFHFYGAPHF